MTGLSRVGKSTEIRSLIAEFNKSDERLPSGKPAKIVSCVLDGKITWKDLGYRTLDALGYSMTSGRLTQSAVWSRVTKQTEEQGVVCIHYDECQHVFLRRPNETSRTLLDSFKALMKDPRWPLMLIMSRVDKLAGHVAQEEQLVHLLRPVHFDGIRLPRDRDKLSSLCFSYCEKAGLDFGDLATESFLRRLDHACVHRWGLVIEILINACLCALKAESETIRLDHFVEAFSERTGYSTEFTPFTGPGFVDIFDSERIRTCFDRSERRPRR